MAITLPQLAGALRLGDGVAAPSEPVLSILTRLLGVAKAYTGLIAGDAPVAVQDEAIVRLVGYLYDAPTASGGDRYAAAWTNSGAGGLVSKWVVQRVAGASTP